MENSELTKKVLGIIADAQMSCASVKLEIGTTTEDNQVVHGGVYIIDCPASVIIALQEAGMVMSMDDGQLHIIYQKEKQGENE